MVVTPAPTEPEVLTSHSFAQVLPSPAASESLAEAPLPSNSSILEVTPSTSSTSESSLSSSSNSTTNVQITPSSPKYDNANTNVNTPVPSNHNHQPPATMNTTMGTSKNRRNATERQPILQKKALLVPYFNPIWSAIIIAAAGGAMYGYNSGIIAGVNDPIINEYFPNSSNKSWLKGTLTASILIGGWLGAILSVSALKKIGLMRSLLVAGMICVIGPILLSTVPTFEALCVVRGFLGLSVGAAAVLCPLYVSEVTVPHLRGRMGIVFQISLCFFILVAQAVNYGFNHSNNPTLPMRSWRTQFALGLIPGFVLFVAAFFVQLPPDQKDKMTMPLEAVVEYEAIEFAEATSPGLAARVRAFTDNEPQEKDTQSNWGELFSRKHIRTLSSACILAFINQLTGINAVIYYAPNIFATANVSDPLLITLCVVGIWNFVSVLISFFAIDKFGRYRLMLMALVVVGIGNLLLTLGYALVSGTDGVPLAIIAVLLVIAGYESGPGPLFFLLAAESFDPSVRHTALSLTNQGAWLCNVLVTFTFPVLTDNIGSSSTFLIFTLITAVCFFLFYFVLKPRPEPMQSNSNSPTPLDSSMEPLKQGHSIDVNTAPTITY